MVFVPPADLAARNISTKPYLEWVRGCYYPKVSPHSAHRRLQIKLGAMMLAWGEQLGVVASEVDTDVSPVDDDTRRYLPDVGFWSFERLRETGQSDAQVPKIPPDLAVEVRTATDDRQYLAEKVRAYVAAGSTAVLVVEADTRRVIVHERTGKRALEEGAVFENESFPGLRLALVELFSVLDRR